LHQRDLATTDKQLLMMVTNKNDHHSEIVVVLFLGGGKEIVGVKIVAELIHPCTKFLKEF